jgi:hypothetical protein
MARKSSGPIHEIVESYEVLEEIGNQTIEINKVAWNERPPKIDIRRWDHGKEDGPVPLKGVTLSDEACDRLAIQLLELGYGDMKEIARIFNERKKRK